MDILIRLVNYIIVLFTVAIFARVLLSFAAYFMKPPYPTLLVSIDRVINQVTEPVLAPIRRMLPSLGGLDLSPMLVIIILWLIREVLASV